MRTTQTSSGPCVERRAQKQSGTSKGSSCQRLGPFGYVHKYQGNGILGDVPTDLSLHQGSSPPFIGCSFVVHFVPLVIYIAREYSSIFLCGVQSHEGTKDFCMCNRLPKWALVASKPWSVWLAIGASCSKSVFLCRYKDPWVLAIESLLGHPFWALPPTSALRRPESLGDCLLYRPQTLAQLGLGHWVLVRPLCVC